MGAEEADDDVVRRFEEAMARGGGGETSSAAASDSDAPMDVEAMDPRRERTTECADGDAAGVWSEFMLYDGHAWRDDRCAVASALCSVLRGAPETNGAILHANGSVKHAAQGQTTLFRVRPGARVLPHVGVTNRRLVVQFPLAGFDGVRFRVGDEWRGYEEGRALVFDVEGNA